VLSVVYVVILLFAYLTSIIFTHALWNRLARSTVAPQGRALLVVGSNLGIFAAVSSRAVIRLGGSLAWIWYIAICLLCVGYCYWSLICLSESGRRYHIVQLVNNGSARRFQDLARLYGCNTIVDERLKRLEQWSEIIRRNDRIFCTRGRLYKASIIVYAWARVLGFRWF